MGYSKGLEIKNDLVAKSIINMMILTILTILILNLSSYLIVIVVIPPWICPERHSLSQAPGCHPHLPWLRSLREGAPTKLPRNYDFQPAKIGSQSTRIRIQMMLTYMMLTYLILNQAKLRGVFSSKLRIKLHKIHWTVEGVQQWGLVKSYDFLANGRMNPRKHPPALMASLPSGDCGTDDVTARPYYAVRV